MDAYQHKHPLDDAYERARDALAEFYRYRTSTDYADGYEAGYRDGYAAAIRNGYRAATRDRNAQARANRSAGSGADLVRWPRRQRRSQG